MLISFGMSTAVAPYQAFGPDGKQHAYRLQCGHRTVLLDKHVKSRRVDTISVAV